MDCLDLCMIFLEGWTAGYLIIYLDAVGKEKVSSMGI